MSDTDKKSAAVRASEIADTLELLRAESAEHGFELLAYLIEMALLEVRSQMAEASGIDGWSDDTKGRA